MLVSFLAGIQYSRKSNFLPCRPKRKRFGSVFSGLDWFSDTLWIASCSSFQLGLYLNTLSAIAPVLPQPHRATLMRTDNGVETPSSDFLIKLQQSLLTRTRDTSCFQPSFCISCSPPWSLLTFRMQIDAYVFKYCVQPLHIHVPQNEIVLFANLGLGLSRGYSSHMERPI